ncbi:hypothetical protein C5167_047164 [Papaver somniferum]|uniref:Elongator complex protein 6 n=1 Tax=Papaver somniferum TaxID=3469 RepID=A0A4Y7LJM8_PAPSO|nr:elongator complex protein 6-like [Papaver somniferum]XP_026425150.1 elongator complex protein 6-like [Papaver somniferum]XP_026425151.1 elongator complex protein 6-like [Papaver somniferum]XP_026425152.1 elongator complex protein 6-like [Papaver somniferum]XP_026425153.1 elongator complex protein 6-like [Papaver somniferum]XP_026425154.1 elongator complex protein 6-like [Papaver somniferum]RZC84379.1 hypothetical protein C5167_047164 [Papaver somniferum]
MERSLNLLDETLVHIPSSKGRVILIEDQVETSGAFVLHHLIKRSLSIESSEVVIFVALSKPFSHYDRILRKLGCNLVAQRENGKFIFIDMLKLECPDGDEGNGVGGGLIDLYRKIQKSVEVNASTSPELNRCITVMMDDLSLLEVAAKGSSTYVLDFLHYCHTLTSENGCSLVVLNHNDIYSSKTGPTLILQMEYLADVVVNAEPLVTGLATDVHGQLTVLNKGAIDEHGGVRSKLHNFHFKVKENSVEYFYPGSRA